MSRTETMRNFTLLEGDWLNDPEPGDEPVIKYVDYYFHHKVLRLVQEGRLTLDASVYSTPAVAGDRLYIATRKTLYAIGTQPVSPPAPTGPPKR